MLGLYISAHPLDAYALYLSEQTQPLTQLVPEYDGRQMTVGGIISTVRTIVTKSGSKMAFVGIEDKFSEGEVIIFPNLYEQIGAKLVQDTVVIVAGKNSARGRDGSLGDESKLIADEVTVVHDNDAANYESTGYKMDAPKMSAKVKQERRASYKAQKTGTPAPTAAPKKPAATVSAAPLNVPQPELPPSRLFLHVKNPDDHDTLVTVKSACGKHPGVTDVVLVLGEEKKSAIRLPFRVDTNETLLSQLHECLTEDCVVLK
ncbi:hypothetical protein EOM33_07235 [Candidatus Saccharibacteria bacterium]|nr:hypothetical protein [Candidatus Saccharibacteria bacterium]